MIVCTSFEPMAAAGRDVLRWLRRLDATGAELWAVDTGAFLLAEAGLLAGRTVTLHWESIAAFAELYGKVETRRSLFERSGRVATCAGGTAGIDLALTAIAAEHGSSLALDVADQLIHQGIRDAAAPQQVAPMRRYGTRNPTVLAAIDLLQRSIEQPPSLAQAAAALGVSPRQLQRLFATHLGTLVQALRPRAAAGAGEGAAGADRPDGAGRGGRDRLRLGRAFRAKLSSRVRDEPGADAATAGKRPAARDARLQPLIV